MEGFKLPDRLAKKENERHLEKGKKRTEATVNEKFAQAFEEKQQLIQSALNDAENNCIESQDLKDHFDQINCQVADLQKLFSHSTVHLPSFHLRKYQGILFEFENKLQSLEKTLVPKKKFSFKNRGLNAEEIKKPVPVDQLDGNIFSSKISYPDDCGFMDKKNEILTLQRSDVARKNVSLSNLDNCTVKIFGSPSTVHITSVKNSTILIGPVSTSVFVEDCSDSSIVVACQQLRVHNTKCVNFYIHVTSRCIMEDSKDISVAPFVWVYDNLAEDYGSSGLDLKSNNWNDVDDFNWLAKDKQSPNWKILEENERRTFC